MGKDMIEKRNLWPVGGEWKEVSVENKLLPPKGMRLKIGESTWHSITKCITVSKSLEWNENPRYYKNSTLHCSLWGPIPQLDKANVVWLEVTWHLNNKGRKDLKAFWDQWKMEWGKALSLRECALLLNEKVMLGRLEERLATIPMPLYMSALEWKAR